MSPLWQHLEANNEIKDLSEIIVRESIATSPYQCANDISMSIICSCVIIANAVISLSSIICIKITNSIVTSMSVITVIIMLCFYYYYYY